MSVQNKMGDGSDPNEKWLYRVGGISGIILGIMYLIIVALYAPIGAPPSGAEARLLYVSQNTTVWWAILNLSVLTDFLFIPLMFALYVALKKINRGLMLLAVAFVLLFVVLDLALTWPNYATLITLSGSYAAAANDTARAVSVAAAYYPAAVVESTLLGVYIILIPGLGILMAGLVMAKGIFNKATAYVGVITGILAVVSVVGPFFVSALGATAILASVGTTVWVLLAGYRLFRLS